MIKKVYEKSTETPMSENGVDGMIDFIKNDNEFVYPNADKLTLGEIYDKLKRSN